VKFLALNLKRLILIKSFYKISLRNIFKILILTILSIKLSFSQGEIASPTEIFYRDERTISIDLTQYGLSLNYRYNQRIDDFNSFITEINISTIKHPKEVKVPANTFYNLNRFVYGKINECYTLKGGLGWQKEIFQKNDKGSISIRRYTTIGITTAILKPIYYIVYVDANGDAYIDYEISEKFNTYKSLQIIDIKSKDSFFKGIGEISLVPGIFLKTGLMLEFGKYEKFISAIDGGIMLEIYSKTLPIMAYTKNYQIYPAFYIGYRFGWAIDARFKTRKGIVKYLISLKERNK